MQLQSMTWPEVSESDKDAIVLIPTGSLEQHGPHLPLFTDTLLATHVAGQVESRLPAEILLTPTLWLGASGHHLKFPGTLSASFESYEGAIQSVVESLVPHGFHRFFILNGHGGNSEPNGIVLRKLKQVNPNLTLGHSSYFAFAAELASQILEGPLKEIRHACEAEVSMMLHIHPELVRVDKLRDDGLYPEPKTLGMVYHFDEQTDKGSFGYATLASASKGKLLLDAAIDGAAKQLKAIHESVMLLERPRIS
ncbi:MAG: creatininase family protein [Armatimonadetes bacterium]|nr:creatininase family protein [Armatimonadota bacterium]